MFPPSFFLTPFPPSPPPFFFAEVDIDLALFHARSSLFLDDEWGRFSLYMWLIAFSQH